MMMISRGFFWALVSLALMSFSVPNPVLASETTTTLDGESIRKAFEGQTVSGRYTGGGFFTEYHQDNGQALGHNGFAPNTDACWTIVADAICYYYGTLDKRTTHCFTVIRNDRLYVLRTLGESRINALATIESGNLRKHTDNGRPWVCDGLVSQGPGQSFRVMAAW
jgi:hypothetical protein